ncbi:hypothetical protein E0980_24105 [Salmonella enterica subsp. enterica serovar Waycross]|nr:hypothetical protein [Salmonella enterica subsp. enterica serovar Waycross]EEF4188180.1 hypothetical protein [Salmonella enterica]
MVLLILSFSDPKKGSSGSSILATPSGAHSPQHVPPIWRQFHLHIVLFRYRVTRRAGPEKTGVVIPSLWYTSGKSEICRKSDHRKTVIR